MSTRPTGSSATEEEADEFPLDEDEVEVIVGSRQFDLVDLIEEELLLFLPLVPKHDGLSRGAREPGVGCGRCRGRGRRRPAKRWTKAQRRATRPARPNPFAALEKSQAGR